MRNFFRWIIIAALASVYVFALAAVLHPHVSSAYRAYYIDRVSDEYGPTAYETTPEQGMLFSRAGLPQWVSYTHGFSIREGWGRWTDQNIGTIAGLVMNQKFEGDVCVFTTLRAIPWIIGDPIKIKMGGQEKDLRIESVGPTEYHVQFTSLRGADTLDFVLPPKLPAVMDRAHDSSDPRRLGINVASLRLIPGECSATAGVHVQ